MAFLGVVAALPYLNTLRNGFVSDDVMQVLENPFLRSFRLLPKIFATQATSYIPGMPNFYRPLMNVGYLLCYQVFGPDPAAFHFVNIVFNAVVVASVFLFTKRMFQDRNLAFIAAALFAIHPIHSEAVAWVGALPDLQLSFFYLLTFWLFLDVARPGGGFSYSAQLAMAGAFILTIFSKEQAITLPVVATLYEHFYRPGREETRPAQKVARYAVLWLLTAGYLLFRVCVLKGLSSGASHLITWYQTFLSAFALLGQYLGEFLWPVKLRIFCPFHVPFSLANGAVAGGVVASAGFCALFFFLWRHAKPLSFGLVWTLLTLAPVLNARWMPPAAFEERYFYLPSVGLCWVAGWGLLRLQTWASARSAIWTKALAIGFGILVTLSVVRIITRNRVWRDNFTLLTKTLAFCPDAYYTRRDLGRLYFEKGDLGSAEREWREAYNTAPGWSMNSGDLGLLYLKKRQYPEAFAYLRKALELDPDNAPAHLYLGVAYMETHSLQLAEPELRRAVSLLVVSDEARNALGKVYMEEGRRAEAEEQFRRSVAIEPNLMGYSNLGLIDWERGDAKSAEQEWREALRLAPNDSSILNDLGLVSMSQDRYREAVAYFRQAAGLKPNDLLPHLNLGIAYGKLGQNGSAEAEFRAALSLNPANSQAHFQLGALYLSEGRREEALKEYQADLKSDPNDREALAAVQKLRAQPR
jgi:tetratricopeptide (TPR) repeat protein